MDDFRCYLGHARALLVPYLSHHHHNDYLPAFLPAYLPPTTAVALPLRLVEPYSLPDLVLL